MDDALSLTEQLQRFAKGDRQFAEPILAATLPTLRQIAARELGRERRSVSLFPTELIDEVWMRNLHKGNWKIQNRGQFYHIAGLAMHQVLVDRARKRLAQRRGEGQAPISLDDIPANDAPGVASPEQVIEIGLLTEQLAKVDAEAAEVVRLHHFVGYTLEEIAENTGETFHQIRRRWERGRDWLKERLG